jgi:ribosome assembly protein 1
MAPPKTAGAARGTIHGTVLNGLVNYTIRAIPLPGKVTEFLLSNIATMSKMLSQRGESTDEADEQDELEAGEGVQGSQRVLSAQQFWDELEGLFKRAGPEWAGAADRIWSFGPKRLGANVLLDPTGKTKLRYVLIGRVFRTLVLTPGSGARRS